MDKLKYLKRRFEGLYSECECIIYEKNNTMLLKLNMSSISGEIMDFVIDLVKDKKCRYEIRSFNNKNLVDILVINRTKG